MRTRTRRKGVTPANAEIYTRRRGYYRKGITLVLGTDGYRKGVTLLLGMRHDGFRKGVTPLLGNIDDDDDGDNGDADDDGDADISTTMTMLYHECV